MNDEKQNISGEDASTDRYQPRVPENRRRTLSHLLNSYSTHIVSGYGTGGTLTSDGTIVELHYPPSAIGVLDRSTKRAVVGGRDPDEMFLDLLRVMQSEGWRIVTIPYTTWSWESDKTKQSAETNIRELGHNLCQDFSMEMEHFRLQSNKDTLEHTYNCLKNLETAYYELRNLFPEWVDEYDMAEDWKTAEKALTRMKMKRPKP